jgi:hypothetical protein
MVRRDVLLFLSTGGLTASLVVGSSMSGCRSSESAGTGATGTGASTTTSTTGTQATTTTGTQATTTTGTGGSGGAPMAATISDITTGMIGAKVKVELQGVVAMSPKFLVSKSSTTGSCLWGVFVSAPGLPTTAANTGMIALSYGTPASIADGGTEAFCPVLPSGTATGTGPAGDAFPDDVAVGDVLTIDGTVDDYIPKSCATEDAGIISMVPEYELSDVDKVTRTSQGGPVPAPYVLSAADIASLAGQTDQSWYNKWAAVRVELDNTNSVVQGAAAGSDAGGSITDNYGNILVTSGSSTVQIGDKIFYQGLLKSEGQLCHSGVNYASPMTMFTKIDGFVYLDFCTWALEPESRCADLQPPSTDCTGLTCP